MNEGHRQRLRERFEQSGFSGFHDHEVIELLLAYAIPRRDVKPLAKELLTRFGSLSAVVDAPVAHLKQVEGVGSHASVLLAMVPRLMDRYLQDRWKRNESFNSTRDAVRFLSSLLGTQRAEVFCILALNSQNALIAAEEIQRGSVNRTAVFPRLVVEACLKHRATAVILAHNHPGGDPSPSSADRQLTRRLKRLLNDLDIQVHDHIIVAGLAYHSFAEHQELE
ncbi:MAG: DNA repair protein RadC [Syntrophobacteraceae bacterium]|jgi:DNA repair protein RadC|nr:DNA repair protein RadC [Syntrophobacteraceae bacterium]